VSGIEEATVEVDGVEVFFRRVRGSGIPTVYVHGVPTHSEDWMPFLTRTRAPAIALDLPGFGRSQRPAHGYTMHGYASFCQRFLAAVGIDRHKLVVHDWGCVALIAAQRRPDSLERLVVINAVPLLPGYRWHFVARQWRRRGVGELVNKLWNRPALALTMRVARGDRRAWPPEFIEMISSGLDTATKRIILGLYRSAPEPALAAAGAGLGEIDSPSLVLWGRRDPYIPPRFGSAWAERLGSAELVDYPALGHWPWHEDGAVVDRALAFLEE
jgi:pimeloyl-ACP methyl ester carboxylesterase